MKRRHKKENEKMKSMLSSNRKYIFVKHHLISLSLVFLNKRIIPYIKTSLVHEFDWNLSQNFVSMCTLKSTLLF